MSQFTDKQTQHQGINSGSNNEKAGANRILSVTLLVTLISVAGIALPYPILAPLFAAGTSPLTQFLNLPSELLLGIVLGIYPLGIIIGSSIIGAISDNYGRKKILSLTLLGSAFGYSLTAFSAASENFLLFCISRLLTGLCEGNISIARAIAADLHPIIDKTRSFSLISSMGYGGYLLGPLAGGYLVMAGIDMVFWVAALACLTCALMSHILLPKSLNKPDKHAETGSSLSLLAQPDLRRFFLLYLFLTMGVNLYYEYYPLHLVREFGYQPIDISWATVFLTTCMILTSVFINPIIQRRLDHPHASLLGIILFGSALGALPFFIDQGYLITFALMGAGIAIYNGFLPSYLSHSYENRAQGKLMGMLVTIFCLGNLLAALIGGLVSMFDVRWALFLGASISFTAAIIFYHGHFKAKIWPFAGKQVEPSR
ncbi:MFS transporter [Shewanella violacea]|uniref:Multidrug transporter, putative n=1 Tax=Shewanella violacea (strain JCM 10179 / CIP 106290 / LMG 19151 / DSS12) TaxID=637905 RepID=D4ZIL2_SHEVD|nr:MFS transporter [Shewanella violacea]BAJ01511.1 multidrug transporter, putative [Shewanella violacea DSS12]